MPFENRATPPQSRAAFVWRLAKHVGIATALLCLSLGLGMVGYGYYEGLAWRDGFLNAAMLLGGMGPVNAPLTPDGKVFAGLYALYSGLLFLVVASLVLGPVVHRVLHRFHWEEDGD